jgi:hypothetical protein
MNMHRTDQRIIMTVFHFMETQSVVFAQLAALAQQCHRISTSRLSHHPPL